MEKQELSTQRSFEKLRIEPYEHRTRFYETDATGMIHQTNYTKWLEDARMNLLTQLGLGILQMEKMQIMCPLLSESVNYTGLIHFDATIVVYTKVVSYDGRKMDLEYRIVEKGTDELKATAKSSHCFMNRSGIPISLNRVFPELETTFFEFK